MKKQTYLDDCKKQDKIYFNYECPKCGWNALSQNALSQDGLEQGCCEVIASQETDTEWGPGFEMHVKCTCPNCNEEFEYFDGSP